MVLKSFAKINLTLKVKKKLPSGLHDIETFYCLVNNFDKIFIKKEKNLKSDKISFIGPFSKYVSSSNNSVRKILKIMRKYRIISSYYKIKVIKNIPVFSGLGGGSSNAAFILNYLTNKEISKRTLNKIINYVGSDLRLFFYSQGYLKNLQTIIKIKKIKKLYFLIVFPNVKCSTKVIYSIVTKRFKSKSTPKNNFNKKNKFIEYLMRSNNDLQSIVENKYPKVKNLLNSLRKTRGCYLARMSGSGSACYGLYNSKKCSKAALKKLRKEYPKFWFSIAKTI